MTSTRFASALSTRGQTDAAVRETAEALAVGLDGVAPDLLVAFVSHHHEAALAGLGPRLAERTGAARVLGCTGERIVGGDREIEEGPALSLWAVGASGSRLHCIDITTTGSSANEAEFSSYPEVDPQKNPFAILLGEPFSFPMGPYLRALNERVPGLPAIGGMASGGMAAGTNLLFTEEGARRTGAIAACVEGGVELDPVVSQGCRPVGKPFVVTRSEGNLILRLGGQSAVQALRAAMGEMSDDDRELFRRGPFVGLALDPTKSAFEPADFLVRGILGHRPEDDALAVSDTALRTGMTIQFLVRDATSASEELARLMGARSGPAAEAGVLLFSCNGRGAAMFGRPDHDIGRIQAAFDHTVPAAGFFAMGEIGPVGDQNFLHGFTASVGIVRARREATE